MNKCKIKRIMYSEEEIQNIVSRIAGEIKRDYGNDELIVIGIFKGSFMFLSDLVKKLGDNIKIYFMEVSSYGDSCNSSGNVKIMKDIDIDVTNKNLLVVEDIVDSGITMYNLLGMLKSRGAKSVKLAALLSKPSRRKKEVNIDYIGIEIPDEFVVGFGMDYAEKYRNLPYIAVIDEDSL